MEEINEEFKVFFVLLFLFSSLTQISFGQDEDNLFVFELEPEIVVTASKREQSVLESPSAISIITKEEIRASFAFNLGEVFENVVGLDVAYTYNGNIDMSPRGLCEFECTKVLVLVDGQPFNSVAHSNVHWADMPIFLDSVERIEIIRGPGSTLYGANAFTGVINIITKKAQDRESGKVSVWMGEYESYMYSISGSTKLGEKGGLAITAGKIESYGFNDPESTFDSSERFANGAWWAWTDYVQTDMRLDYQFTEKTKLKVTGGWNSGKRAIPEFSNPTKEGYGPSEKMLMRGNLTSNLNENFEIDFALGGTYGIYDWQDVLGYEGKRVNLDFLGTYKFSQKNMIIGGLSYEWTSSVAPSYEVFMTDENGSPVLDTEGNPIIDEVDGLTFDYDEKISTYSAFLQTEFYLTDLFKFYVSGRYDKINFLDGVFSPRVCALFIPNNKHTIRLAYATSFRPPSYAENYANLRVQRRTPILGIETEDLNGDKSNPEPETITSLELGYNGSFMSNKMKFSLEGYYMEINDLVRSIYYPTEENGQPYPEDVYGYLRYTNISKMESTGLEFELKWKIISQLTSFVNYTWQDVRSKEVPDPENAGQTISVNEKVLLVPENKANIGLLFNDDKTGLYGKFICHWFDEVETIHDYGSFDDPPFSGEYVYIKEDAHMIFDLGVGIKLFDSLDVMVGCYNLLDEDEIGYSELFFESLYDENKENILTTRGRKIVGKISLSL